MKTIEVSASSPSLKELLRIARKENIIIKEQNGEEYILALIDDFDAEVQRLQHNDEFIAFLDARAKEPKISFEKARKRLLQQD